MDSTQTTHPNHHPTSLTVVKRKKIKKDGVSSTTSTVPSDEPSNEPSPKLAVPPPPETDPPMEIEKPKKNRRKFDPCCCLTCCCAPETTLQNGCLTLGIWFVIWGTILSLFYGLSLASLFVLKGHVRRDKIFDFEIPQKAQGPLGNLIESIQSDILASISLALVSSFMLLIAATSLIIASSDCCESKKVPLIISMVLLLLSIILSIAGAANFPFATIRRLLEASSFTELANLGGGGSGSAPSSRQRHVRQTHASDTGLAEVLQKYLPVFWIVLVTVVLGTVIDCGFRLYGFVCALFYLKRVLAGDIFPMVTTPPPPAPPPNSTSDTIKLSTACAVHMATLALCPNNQPPPYCACTGQQNQSSPDHHQHNHHQEHHEAPTHPIVHKDNHHHPIIARVPKIHTKNIPPPSSPPPVTKFQTPPTPQPKMEPDKTHSRPKIDEYHGPRKAFTLTGEGLGHTSLEQYRS